MRESKKINIKYGTNNSGRTIETSEIGCYNSSKQIDENKKK